MILLVIPLIVLGAAYLMISSTLWQSIDTERQLVKQTSGKFRFEQSNRVQVMLALANNFY